MIRNSRNQYVHWHELYPLLGLNPKEHLPREGFEKEVEYNGRVVKYKCSPASTINPGVRGGKPQRVTFECDCGRWIPFGRAGQHIRACKAEAEARFMEACKA